MCKLDAKVEEDHAAAFAFAKETYGQPVYAAYANAGVAPLDVIMTNIEDLSLASDIAIDCSSKLFILWVNSMTTLVVVPRIP